MSMRRPPFHRSLASVRTPPAHPGRRIGLLGGSFDPPHFGHLALSETALRRLRLDRLWWIVTPGNPLKETARLAGFSERIARCRQMISDPRIDVTGFEAALPDAFTARTIGFLKARFPRTRFVWVMGADNLAAFHHWKHWRQIAAQVPMAVIDRPGWRLSALASPASQRLQAYRINEELAAGLADRRAPAWTYLGTRLAAVSSTEIRKKTSNTTG
jgi:nicotinate-nucleotide adenylyltransferase